MKEITFSLLTWIAANSVYEMPSTTPRVVTTDVENLVYLALGEVPIIPQRARTGLKGLYDPATRTIWMREDFDRGRDRHLLVHELVHFLQHDQPARAPPEPRIEAEAVRLQTLYRHQQRSGSKRDPGRTAAG